MCPNHLRHLCLSRACMLEHLPFSSTVVFGILSCQVIPKICLRQCRWNEFSFASCLTFWDFLLLDAYLHFWYSLRWQKNEVMAHNAEIPPSINIDGSNLSVVGNFKNLGSTISTNLSLDVEINERAATVMTKLNKRVGRTSV